MYGYSDLRAAFSEAALNAADPEVERVLSVFALVCSLWLAEDAGPNPYRPLIVLSGERSLIPEDITDDVLTFLSEVMHEIDDDRLSARCADVLYLRLEGRARIDAAMIALDAWSRWPLDEETWYGDGHAAWARALDLAKRLGDPAQLLGKMEQRLLDRLFELNEGGQLVSIGEILLRHRLSTERASEIAGRFQAAAATSASDGHRARRYLSAAVDWFRRGSDEDSARAAIFAQVESWIRDAEFRRSGPQGNLVAAGFYESALQTLRQLPRSWRVSHGAAELAEDLQKLARESGQESLSEFSQFRSDPIDLSDAVRHSVDRVSGRSLEDGLMAFATLAEISDYEDQKSYAETLNESFPLQSLFANVHIASDGRVVHKSQETDAIYGISAPTWRQMVRNLEMKIHVLVQGGLLPALNQLTNEHRASVHDFKFIAAESSIIPRDRAALVGRGLAHGFNGDFASALHLLTPQLENLVRVHMRNAGVSTSTINANGVETENGLTTLMESDAAVQVFGADIAFEIRALYCGPVGSNLRNVVAHGLVSDSDASSLASIYSWWLMLKLVYTPFWNRRRDVGDTPDRPSEE